MVKKKKDTPKILWHSTSDKPPTGIGIFSVCTMPKLATVEDYWESRSRSISNYHKVHPYKCPKCNNEKIGITYTTGTGNCGKCSSGIILTDRGLVAVQHDKKNGAFINCKLWFEDGKEEICSDCNNKGPALCDKYYMPLCY